MLLFHIRLRALLFAIATVCLQPILAVAQDTHSDATNSARSTPQTMHYFPANAFDSANHLRNDAIAGGLTKYLSAISEPSLLDIAKDASAVSYRFIRRSYPSGMGLVVRLIVDQRGRAELRIVETSGGNATVSRTTRALSADAVEGFLSRVDESDFWSLPATEVDEPPLSKDGDIWTIEGARNGEYRVVHRRNPKPSRYTELGRYMAKDLAKLDDSTFVAAPRSE